MVQENNKRLLRQISEKVKLKELNKLEKQIKLQDLHQKALKHVAIAYERGRS